MKRGVISLVFVVFLLMFTVNISEDVEAQGCSCVIVEYSIPLVPPGFVMWECSAFYGENHCPEGTMASCQPAWMSQDPNFLECGPCVCKPNPWGGGGGGDKKDDDEVCDGDNLCCEDGHWKNVGDICDERDEMICTGGLCGNEVRSRTGIYTCQEVGDGKGGGAAVVDIINIIGNSIKDIIGYGLIGDGGLECLFSHYEDPPGEEGEFYQQCTEDEYCDPVQFIVKKEWLEYNLKFFNNYFPDFCIYDPIYCMGGQDLRCNPDVPEPTGVSFKDPAECCDTQNPMVQFIDSDFDPVLDEEGNSRYGLFGDYAKPNCCGDDLFEVYTPSEIPGEKGRCAYCPEGQVWNGESCIDEGDIIRCNPDLDFEDGRDGKNCCNTHDESLIFINDDGLEADNQPILEDCYDAGDDGCWSLGGDYESPLCCGDDEFEEYVMGGCYYCQENYEYVENNCVPCGQRGWANGRCICPVGFDWDERVQRCRAGGEVCYIEEGHPEHERLPCEWEEFLGEWWEDYDPEEEENCFTDYFGEGRRNRDNPEFACCLSGVIGDYDYSEYEEIEVY